MGGGLDGEGGRGVIWVRGSDMFHPQFDNNLDLGRVTVVQSQELVRQDALAVFFFFFISSPSLR